MECCCVSQLLLKAEEGCFGNSVKARSITVPCLIHINSLLCPASIHQYNKNFFLNQSQSYNLNASLMFCFANSSKYTYFHSHNRMLPKIYCSVILVLFVQMQKCTLTYQWEDSTFPTSSNCFNQCCIFLLKKKVLLFILDRKKLPVVSAGQQVKFKMLIVLVLKFVDTFVSYCDKIVGIKTKNKIYF